MIVTHIWYVIKVFIFSVAPVKDSNHDDINHNEKGEDRTQKLLESIAQVSDMASQQSGFVYDSSSGLYYDVQTGMYYDQVAMYMYVLVCECVCMPCVCPCVCVCVHACGCVCG